MACDRTAAPVRPRRMRVATTGEIPVGQRKIVELEGRSIGIFNVGGCYVSLRNPCPHNGAPLCLGTVTGALVSDRPGDYRYDREGKILRCPWHGWEFDMTTGQAVAGTEPRIRSYEVEVDYVSTYPVEVDQGIIFVRLR